MAIFLDNKYTTIYYNIVNRALSENRAKRKGKFYADHHIIPEHFFKNRSRPGPSGWLDGNPETPDNHVLLTFREHRLCHLLLRNMMPAETNMSGTHLAAAFMLKSRDENGNIIRTSSRLYENVMIEANIAISEHQRSLVALGIHNLQTDNPNKDGRNAKLAYQRGTHVWLSNNPSIRKSKDGTHQMFRREDGSSIGGDANIKRINEGTHNFLGSESNQKRIDEGTHNFLGSSSNEKMLADGTHPSQQMKTCPICTWTVSSGMFKRWHGLGKCHMDPTSGRYNPNLKQRKK